MTSVGRKGSAWDVVMAILERLDPDWTTHRVKSGLISGEGLIYHVRDPVMAEEEIKETKGPDKGKVVGTQTVTVDPGVADKRLTLIETEFCKVLKVGNRRDNTTTDVCRQF